MTANRLIDLTLKEIAQEYFIGALPWTKRNRPNEWGKMLTLEQRVNEMALGGGLDGLREALNSYRELILVMVKRFKARKEKKGQGMFNFVERPMSPGTG